jgi:hypothetical protein
MSNPFAVVSPEEMKPEQAEQLFVEMYSEYPKISRFGNLIISGARGCGKSMLIRCSLPDVQMIREHKKLNELDNLSFSVSCEKTYPNVKEFDGLENKHAPYLINEHFLTLHVIMSALWQLSQLEYDTSIYVKEEYENFFQNIYQRYLRLSRCKDIITPNYSSTNAFFLSLYKHIEEMQSDLIDYPSKFSLNTEEEDYSYNMPLLSFIKFILPVFKALTNLPGFPQNKNIFIFIDDADNLSKIQTEILNTWIAYRTQPTISLKVSTQLNMYKTYFTSTGVLIESPHDYQDLIISDRYTTFITDYFSKAKDILKKRLEIAGINTDIEEFFPCYDHQEEGIEAEIEKIKVEYPTQGRGYRENDDIRRYAIPNYIKNLGNTRKSRSTYRYAGLDNIIHLSSGIIRYLLDAVAEMYDEQEKDNKQKDNHQLVRIETDIQNDVSRKQADKFLYSELIKTTKNQNDEDEAGVTPTETEPQNDIEKLQNLICAMGRTFHDILVSNRAERKVFSIALSNNPDDELKRIFKLGVRLGFFHEARIGTKDGSGRTLLYILNRCFAPLFTLDPTSFQGYLFMTNEDLRWAIKTGKQLRDIDIKTEEEDIKQLTLDDIWED